MLEELYRESEGINWSTLKYMKKSPADYYMAKQYQTSSTDSQKLGTAIHCGLLQPDLFKKIYKPTPSINWGNKEAKLDTVHRLVEALGDEFLAILPDEPEKLKKGEIEALVDAYGKDRGYVFLPDRGNLSDTYCWEKVAKCVETNQHKPVFKAIREAVEHVELPLYGHDDMTGLKLKGQIDILTGESLIDLKTISGLGKRYYNIRSYDYLGQLAYYNYLCSLNGMVKNKYFILFIETVSPYKMKMVEVDPQVIRAEHEINLQLLQRVKDCENKAEYPDDSDEFETYGFRPELYEEINTAWVSNDEDGEEPLD